MPDQGQIQYGGISIDQDDGKQVGGLFDVIGRIGNNINGTTANNRFNAEQAEMARIFSASEAQKDRDFQERMSSTAYQRAAKDMLAAGINPATLTGLSGGSAASTPSGSTASGTSASASSSGKGAGDFIGSLLKMAIAVALMS